MPWNGVQRARPLHQVRTQVVWEAGHGPQGTWGERLVLGDDASE